MKYFILLTGLFTLGGVCFSQSQDVTVSWNPQAHCVEYNLKSDSLVKLRVGSPQGPVYCALVNCQRRKAGINREEWQTSRGKAAVDFGPEKDLCFSVETGDRMQKDRSLSIDLLDKNGLSFRVNVAGGIKACTPFKIMVFANNKLIKLLRGANLPCSVELKGDLKRGDLLTFNLWPANHAWVACHSFVLAAGNIADRPAKSVDLTGTLVYCRRQNNFWQILSSDLDGSNEKQLTKDAGSKRFPGVSPDGKYIVYTNNNGELWVMNLDGKGQRRIAFTKNVHHPRWRLDNKNILFTSLDDVYRGDSSIWEVDVLTGKSKQIVNRPWLQYDAAESPGSDRIIFVDGPELYGQGIYAFDTKTGDAVRLTEDSREIYDVEPAYFPDAKNIVYLSNKGGSYNLWVMDSFGRNPLRITQGDFYNANPCPASDNKTIFFLSDRGGSVNVWRINRDGSGLAQITTGSDDKQDMSAYTKTK